MDTYSVRKYSPRGREIFPEVPASKSILARALVLAALSKQEVALSCNGLSEDSVCMTEALHSLGVSVERSESGLVVFGTGLRSTGATVFVGNAGTAARFLPAAVAFSKGKCEFDCSSQMSRRPMSVLPLLEEHGVKISYLGEQHTFPFRMDASGFRGGEFLIDTAESTQYASAILLSSCAAEEKTKVRLYGPRTNGSYLTLTKKVLESFGATVEDRGTITVTPPKHFASSYAVEPDLSSACYFFALSLLFGEKVTVRGLQHSLQGDMRFLDVLKEKGVRVKETEDGLSCDGRGLPPYNGFDVDMRDFSDQALTVAALALFARSPSILRGLGHTRGQESDRIRSIVENVNALGARAFSSGEDVFIEPEKISGGTVRTFGDHRVAMAFTLVGMMTGNVVIDDKTCVKKTFPRFFEEIEKLYN